MAALAPYYVAFDDGTGHVCLMAFVQQEHDGGVIRPANPEFILAEIHKSGYTATSYIVVDPADLPDPDQAMDWVIQGGEVVIGTPGSPS
jgi:hypothetical protein